MCIRDRVTADVSEQVPNRSEQLNRSTGFVIADRPARYLCCPLYTSDAADDLLCVDLGGRSNIKKKNKQTDQAHCREPEMSGVTCRHSNTDVFCTKMLK